MAFAGQELWPDLLIRVIPRVINRPANSPKRYVGVVNPVPLGISDGDACFFSGGVTAGVVTVVAIV